MAQIILSQESEKKPAKPKIGCVNVVSKKDAIPILRRPFFSGLGLARYIKELSCLIWAFFPCLDDSSSRSRHSLVLLLIFPNLIVVIATSSPRS